MPSPQILARPTPAQDRVLTPQALAFLAGLERRFGAERRHLLARRGGRPGFLAATRAIREGDWTIGSVPADLRDRRVEITGPVDRKMIINALNSGAQVFMADFEDSCAPTWSNLVEGQHHLIDAVRRTIEHQEPRSGKVYRLHDKTAVLVARPRGLHLEEAHVHCDGLPVSASFFDFGLYLFHNARELLARGSGPYFYLPKLESHREARLWNDVFVAAQEALGLPRGTIKATVLIETLPAAFEMDEILFELREHVVGLNCGRWDYIFSCLKTRRDEPAAVLPDRALVTMEQPFLRAYSTLLIQTCHRRGAHAIGGMAAQIPIKDDAARNERALAKVRADKEREVKAGHDGTWVAHPGLVPLAREVFDAGMPGPHQLHVRRDDVTITADDLLAVPAGPITEAGLRHNLHVAIAYLDAWLRGNGCVPLHDLMEDAATAEISRTQVWQWLRHGARLADGRLVDEALIRSIAGESALAGSTAHRLLLELVTAPTLADFLTLHAYPHLLTLTQNEGPPMVSRHDNGHAQDSNTNGNGHSRPDVDPCLRGVAPSRTRFDGICRDFSPADVDKLRGSYRIEHTLARLGAERLWRLLHEQDFVRALGALTGGQAVQMVRAGLQAIYLSGWQVAADANLAGQTYPDQSLYPSNSVPAHVGRLNAALLRADQIDRLEGKSGTHWLAPIVADAEAGFGGPLNAFELMKSMIEAGAAAVHFEDQLAAEKKCGHLGGKVLVPTRSFIRTLNAARLAADVLDVPTILVARTDADAATLITSDVDERDRPFLTGERTAEGFFRIRAGLETAIARGLAYAPYADVVWCETSHPDLGEAREFAQGIHARFPGKLLAYNCSPSFHWRKKLDERAIASFQEDLGAMGYKFQFVTLAGFHSLNEAMFRLASDYKARGMAAYAELQTAEFASEAQGYTAVKHQREVGTGYFDAISNAISAGESSTVAMKGSTEEAQFGNARG
jgi:malate synthase A